MFHERYQIKPCFGDKKGECFQIWQVFWPPLHINDMRMSVYVSADTL